MATTDNDQQGSMPPLTGPIADTEGAGAAIVRRLILVASGAGVLLIFAVTAIIILTRPVAAATIQGEALTNPRFSLTVPKGWKRDSQGQSFVDLYKNGKYELLRIGVGKPKWPKDWPPTLAAKICSIIEDVRRPAIKASVHIDPQELAINGPRGVSFETEYVYAPPNDVAYTGKDFYWVTVAKGGMVDYQVQVSNKLTEYEKTFRSAWPLVTTVQWKAWKESDQNPAVPDSRKLQKCGKTGFPSVADPNYHSVVG